MNKPGFKLREVRLRGLALVLLLLSLLINYSIANASSLRLDGFAPVVVRPERVANYGKDPFSLVFPPVNPELGALALSERNQVEPSSPNESAPTATPPGPTATPTATPLLVVPTFPPLLPTLPPLLPTLPPLLPTLPPLLPTLVPTQLQPIVETVVAPLPTAIPTVCVTIIVTICL